MASYDQAGSAATSINMPWKLRFEATGDFKFPATKDAGYTDFREDLASIPSGSTLWNIYAMDKPQELGGTEKQIAKMVTASECTTSLFGDDHLYFRHQRMDDDLKLRPEWEQYTPKYGGIFSLEEQYDNEPSGCPFANIIDYLQ